MALALSVLLLCLHSRSEAQGFRPGGMPGRPSLPPLNNVPYPLPASFLGVGFIGQAGQQGVLGGQLQGVQGVQGISGGFSGVGSFAGITGSFAGNSGSVVWPEVMPVTRWLLKTCGMVRRSCPRSFSSCSL